MSKPTNKFTLDVLVVTIGVKKPFEEGTNSK